jgi:hypothetical protein
MQVSILPTIYKQLFCTKVFCADFLFLQFVFVIFWQKKIGEKTAREMLVKLTKGLFMSVPRAGLCPAGYSSSENPPETS